MSFGDKVLRNTTISGKKPKPVCMSLPGGISKFCGRVYGISREGDQFKACLGLELRAFDDVEAALRVSCFRFGPQGMKVDTSQPLPASQALQGEDEEDEDDEEDDEEDDDDYGLDDSDDEDEDDDNAADEDTENDVESDGDSDYTGLSALSTNFLDSLFGGGGSGNDDDTVAETSNKPTSKPMTVKSKVTTPQPPSINAQKKPEKQLLQGTESVTSTSYTVSIVQDPMVTSSEVLLAEARPTANAPFNDNPTDRVETVPTSATLSDKDKKKDKDYDEDDDDDDDSNEEDEEEGGDIVSDILASAASAVGLTDTDKNSTTVAVVTAKSVNKQVTTEAETTTVDSDVAKDAKDYNDDDDDDDDDYDGEGYRNLRHIKPSVMPVAIVPNDRRGRTHRRMRLSSSDDEESAIHFMKKV